MEQTEIQQGEIRHVSRRPRSLIKVDGPNEGETFNDSGEIISLNMYLVVHEFPKHHYVVILKLVDSYITPGNKFYLVNLITHSGDYNNIRIRPNMYYIPTIQIDLSDSYITRDKFLISDTAVKKDKVYGKFDLVELARAMQY